MLDDNGFLTLFEANPKEYKELTRSKVCGKTWATPRWWMATSTCATIRTSICVPLK